MHDLNAETPSNRVLHGSNTNRINTNRPTTIRESIARWSLSGKPCQKSLEGGNCSSMLKNTPGSNARSTKASTKTPQRSREGHA